MIRLLHRVINLPILTPTHNIYSLMYLSYELFHVDTDVWHNLKYLSIYLCPLQLMTYYNSDHTHTHTHTDLVTVWFRILTFRYLNKTQCQC